MDEHDEPDDASFLKRLIRAWPRLFRGEPPEVPSFLEPGWSPLVHSLFTDIDALLTDEQAQRFQVGQIKEKFAALRVYWSLRPPQSDASDEQATEVSPAEPAASLTDDRGPPPESIDPDEATRKRIGELVDAAATKSESLCQVCGEAGKLRKFGLYITLCDEHFALRESGDTDWRRRRLH